MSDIDTKLITPEQYDSLLQSAADCLRGGGLVAFPTETVYGLGGNALLAQSAEKIYQVKGRPSDNPLIVHIASLSEAEQLGKEIPDAFYRLAEMFWPGPLTMIVKKQDCVPDSVTGGLSTVAIRMPSHPVAQRLISLAGCPVAAPSANLSGGVSPTLAKHVVKDLDGKIDYIIDGGNAEHGLESTVLSLVGEHPVILRPGSITYPMLLDILPDTRLHESLTGSAEMLEEKPASPGMKYKHYSPKAKVVLLYGTDDQILAFLKQADHEKSCVFLYEEQQKPSFCHSYCLGSREDLSHSAARIFAYLRDADDQGFTTIYIPAVPEKGLGLALMNRLKKSAGGNCMILKDETM